MATPSQESSLPIQSRVPLEAMRPNDSRFSPSLSSGPGTPNRLNRYASDHTRIPGSSSLFSGSRNISDPSPASADIATPSMHDTKDRIIHQVRWSIQFFHEFLRLFNADTASIAEYANVFDTRILGDIWMAKIMWQEKQMKQLRRPGQMGLHPNHSGVQQPQTAPPAKECFKTVARNLYQALSEAREIFSDQNKQSSWKDHRHGSGGEQGWERRVVAQSQRIEKLFAPAMNDPNFMVAFCEELDVFSRIMAEDHKPLDAGQNGGYQHEVDRVYHGQMTPVPHMH